MSLVPQEPLEITLLSLRAQGNGAEIALCVRLEAGGYREQKQLVIATEQYCEIKPVRGQLSRDAYEAIERAAEIYSAVKRGEGLLSYGANSARRLTQKLEQRGYSREACAAATSLLVEKGLLDERQDVAREVERCVCKLWGIARIRAHLRQKGYSEVEADLLQELLEEVDFVANCAALIQKRYREDLNTPEQTRRAVAALGRYGYSLQEIKAAIIQVKRSDEADPI